MIFNMTGGGSGSGATLVVSCPANVTVTVSKDDKYYTKNSGNLGSATFKGLATGEWTVTIEGNEQTATKNITITADYAITIAFFAAYINITYPANSTCTVKSSGGTTVASDSNTDSSAKTWMVTVNSTGTYTVTATATDGSGKSKSTTVSITAEGQNESVTLTYAVYYYNNGDLCSSITGGWVSYGYAVVNNESARLSVASNNTSESAPNAGGTNQSIDLTNIGTLTFIGYCSNSSSNNQFGIIGSKENDGVFSAYVKPTKSKGTVTLDVSAYTGSYYIAVKSATSSSPVYLYECYGT